MISVNEIFVNQKFHSRWVYNYYLTLVLQLTRQKRDFLVKWLSFERVFGHWQRHRHGHVMMLNVGSL
jgi:hypothetical protein